MKEQERDEITYLARQISQISRRSSLPSGEPTNSFLDTTTDPELDPNSESFNQKKWVKNLLHITSRDPEKYPRRTAGVTFRNLNAYGFGTAADYQADVFNTWLKAFGYMRGWLGLRKKRRIDILRDFEGLVKSGEMLVVLGRPGRYVYPVFCYDKHADRLLVVARHCCVHCVETRTVSGSMKELISNMKESHTKKCTVDFVEKSFTKASRKFTSPR
jgi:hypothetical protein